MAHFHTSCLLKKKNTTVELLSGNTYCAYPFLAVEIDEDETDGGLAYGSVEFIDEQTNNITFRIGTTDKGVTLIKIVRYHKNSTYNIDLDNTPTLRKQ